MPKKAPTRGRPRKPPDNSDVRTRFGATLRRLRDAKKLSAEDAAAAVSVVKTTWYNWESGLRLPDLTQLRPIARVLGCRVERLIPE